MVVWWMLQAEKEQRRKEEEEKAEAAEYDKWKDMFTVDQEGMAAAEEEGDSQALLEEFVTYIKVKGS